MTTNAAVLDESNDPFCLTTADASRLLHNAPWQRFVVIGDSLAAGTGDASPGYVDLGWPDRVAAALRRVHRRLEYQNFAVVGATAADTLMNQTRPMRDFRPDLIHLSCGSNDLFARHPDFDGLTETLQLVFGRAAATGAQLTTFTCGQAFNVPKIADFSERVGQLNAITRRVARDHGAELIDMWDHPVNRRVNLLSADRIHWSTSGQAVLAGEVVRHLACVAQRPLAGEHWAGAGSEA